MLLASPELSSAVTIKRDPGDVYLRFLGWALLGYALLGRGFAYIGIPPLYIGEATLVAGLIVLFARRYAFRAAEMPLLKLLLCTIFWGMACTIPYIGEYQVDALRDAVLWGYSLFAFVVAGLIIGRPSRLRHLMIRYQTFVVLFVWGALAVRAMNLTGIEISIPLFEGNLLRPKSGDTAVHLTGCAAFMILGLSRNRVITMISALAVLATLNRAGVLAFACATVIVLMLAPVRGRVLKYAYTLLVAVMLLLLLNVSATIGHKELSVDHVISRMESVLGRGDTRDENTKQWRLLWWSDIVDYTVWGPHFWTGKGYGINLADDDGYQVSRGENILRSPHNSHLTFLARSGVPGFLLWISLITSWLMTVLSRYVLTRRRSQPTWTAFFTFLLAYFTAVLVNAMFDVVLESPMGGIWFWVIFGVGMAAVRVYDTTPEVLLEEDQFPESL